VTYECVHSDRLSFHELTEILESRRRTRRRKEEKEKKEEEKKKPLNVKSLIKYGTMQRHLWYISRHSRCILYVRMYILIEMKCLVNAHSPTPLT
jgi:hypothetical protein